MKQIRLFIKRGNPNSQKHLSDISLYKAKYVGILLADTGNNDRYSMSSNDINALKSLFSIMNIASKANIVVEAESHETVLKIERLLDTIDKSLNKRIIVFSHNSVLGNILGKSLINPTFSILYHDLLSYDGCEFYGIDPMDIEKALYTYNDCIPIINYDDDDEIDGNGNVSADSLYILSDTRETLGIREEKKSFVKPLNLKNYTKEASFSIFIFSQSGNARFVIDEIDRNNQLNGMNITCYSYLYNDDYDEIAKKIKEINGKKKILLLSSDGIAANNQDEDIFLSASSFKLNGCINENTEFIAEISNPSHMNSLKNFGVMSVVISNRIISLFMVQLLTHPGSKKFYRDLLSTNGENENDAIDLDIVKASDIIEFREDTISFACKSELVQSFYLATKKKHMCIGIKFENAGEILFLCDKMDEEEKILLQKNDELILVNYC